MGLVLRILGEAIWAPLVVSVAFLLSVGSGHADTYDWAFHLAGGAAIAYGALRVVSLAPGLAARTTRRTRPAVSLFVALGVAVLWEGAEWIADRTLGTRLQHGALESARDIGYGAIGAVAIAALARLFPNRAHQK